MAHIQCIAMYYIQYNKITYKWNLQVEGTSKRCEMMVFVRPYPCQCHNSIRRGCPAGDHKAGFMPVDAQEVRCRIMWVHKWSLRI